MIITQQFTDDLFLKYKWRYPGKAIFLKHNLFGVPKEEMRNNLQMNLNNPNTDGSFTTAYTNSFFSSLEIHPIA